MLPNKTMRALDRVAPKGNRSRAISEAAERLKAGYLANAQRDLDIAREWFPLEEEAWRRTAPRAKARK